MSNPLLIEPHNLKNGDRVLVRNRFRPGLAYEGSIFKIVNKVENEYTEPSRWIDYFYVTFPEPIYHELLQRGWEIIYKNRVVYVGTIQRNPATNHIEKLYSQEKYSTVECEIEMKNMNAILMGRIAYDIRPFKHRSNL